MNLLKRSMITALVLSLAFFLPGQTDEDPDHESRDLKEYQELSGMGERTKYQINVEVFPEKREIRGEEIIKWTNRSGSEVSFLRFNLFLNAFSDPGSTFFRGTSIYKEKDEKLARYHFGNMIIKKIEIINLNGTIKGDFSHVSPDDGNPDDRTVVDFSLKKPVVPGQTVWIRVEFNIKTPDIFFRTGQSGNYFLMAYWYPKIAVQSEDGAWQSHQFHVGAGLYSEFCDFHVRIKIPAVFKVGATGGGVSEDISADGLKVVEFSQENVQDFAWTAYPGFEEIHEKLKIRGNDFDTEIILLLTHRNRAARERYLNAARFALNYFSENLAPYPRRTLTIVDPPLQGFNSAGYEYPLMITAAYLKILPPSVKLPELSVIHGISHQFWFSEAGSDSFREPWLDEGIAVFYEMEIMDRYFGKRGSILNSLYLKIYDWEIKRRAYITLSPLEESGYPFRDILDRKMFVGNVYSKFSLLLRSLKNIIGEKQFLAFFRHYFSRVRNGHHDTELLKNEWGSYFNGEYSWAFDQFPGTDTDLDHAVFSLSSNRIGKSGKFRNEAVFVRNSGFFPVEISVRLKNGKEIKMFWEKNEKWKKLIFTDKSPVISAMVDPGFRIPLDINLVNNSRALDKDNSILKRLSARFGFYFQNILTLLPLQP